MPLISGAHTQEVRPGRAHPSPDLPGGEHKKPPFLARGASRPGRLSRGCTHLAAEMEAPPDRSGRRPQEGPRGGRRGDRSTPVPRRRRWWPWPSWGLSSIRYGRGGLGRAGSRQSGPRTPRLPPATAPAGWAPLCHLTVLPTARRTLGPSRPRVPRGRGPVRTPIRPPALTPGSLAAAVNLGRRSHVRWVPLSDPSTPRAAPQGGPALSGAREPQSQICWQDEPCVRGALAWGQEEPPPAGLVSGSSAGGTAWQSAVGALRPSTSEPGAAPVLPLPCPPQQHPAAPKAPELEPQPLPLPPSPAHTSGLPQGQSFFR